MQALPYGGGRAAFLHHTRFPKTFLKSPPGLEVLRSWNKILSPLYSQCYFRSSERRCRTLTPPFPKLPLPGRSLREMNLISGSWFLDSLNLFDSYFGLEACFVQGKSILEWQSIDFINFAAC